MPSDVVAELVDRIMYAHHGGIDPQIDEEWKNEVRRRWGDYQAGRGDIVSAEEMKARLRGIK